MARGFIRGALWGACVSFGAVTLISVVDDGPNSDARTAGNTTAPRTEAQTTTQTTSSILTAQSPAPDTLSGLAEDVVLPAAVPQTGQAPVISQTELPLVDPQVGLTTDNNQAPRVSSTRSDSLSTPSPEPIYSISTDPAQPPVPALTVPQSAFDEPIEVAEAIDAAALETAPEVMAEAPLVASIASESAQVASPDVSVEMSALDANPSPIGDADDAMASEVSKQTVSGPKVMTQAPQSFENSEPTASALDLGNGDNSTSVPDAPQPQVTTDLTAPETTVVADLEVLAPEVTQEANAPLVSKTADLGAPAQADAAQTADESETAKVTAGVSINLETQAPTENSVGLGTLVVAEAPAPVPAPRPTTPAQANPDDVATPDQAQFVANSVQPEVLQADVRVNRLPTLGQDDADSAPEETVDVVLPPDQNNAQPPVEANAEPFENPENKPVMSIVLMDQGQDLAAEKIGLPALRSFPYPVTFAVDAMLPDAQDRIDSYRAEGFEVLATVDLPEGATAADAEVNMAVALNRVQNVVGVLEGVSTGVQTSRDSGRQVAQILAQSGHGLVTQNVGLNTVQKLAAKEGVPSAIVFRDFDAKGQSPAVIRRFLDQAAFKSGQEGGVIMLGRLREETIAALLLWGLQDRASRVALVPVTGALRVDP